MTTDKPLQSKDLLFHALTSLKRSKEGMVRQLHYSFPRPDSAVSAKELKGAPGVRHKVAGSTEVHSLPVPQNVDSRIRYRFEELARGVIPERFILELENGRVFGEGHVITADNRLVSDVSVYFSQHRDHWLLGLGKLPEPKHIKGTVAVLDSVGSNNYFHWTLDTLPRINLLTNQLDAIDWFYISNATPFQQAWIGNLGIPKEKILPISPQTHIQADRLLVPSFSHQSGLYTNATFSFIRSFMPHLTVPTRKIYISRSNSRRRRIVNEDAMLPFLRQQGYEVHRLAGMTVNAQMRLFGSASHLVSAHGAELTNLVYCAPGTKVFEIFSPYYVNLGFWSIAAQLKLGYSCMLGEGGEQILKRKKNSLHVWRNIRINPEQLQRNLESFATAHE